MGDVVKFKRPTAAEKHKGKTLCKSGFHKWKIVQEKQFDVQQGQAGDYLRMRALWEAEGDESLAKVCSERRLPL